MRGAFLDQGKLFSYISPEARVPLRPSAEEDPGACPRGARRVEPQLGEALRERGTSVDPSGAIAERIAACRCSTAFGRNDSSWSNWTTIFCTAGLSGFHPTIGSGTRPASRRTATGCRTAMFSKFMTKLLNHPKVKPLLSDEHFSVDGTLIEAWASQKSFRPKDGSGDEDGGANFHGQKRKNDTHASTTDPESRLYRKAAGHEAKLSYMGHATMENRHGLAVAGMVTHANGTAERRAAEIMLKARSKAVGRRITAGEDKAYDTADHVANLRASNVTPHVTQNNSPTKTGKSRRSAIDERTTRHEGYGMSQSRRAMIECIFGWGKQHGTMRKTKHRGIRRIAADFLLNLIAYNLIRIPKLVAA